MKSFKISRSKRPKPYADLLRSHRTAGGFTLRQVADALRTTPLKVHGIEYGNLRPPKWSDDYAICRLIPTLTVEMLGMARIQQCPKVNLAGCPEKFIEIFYRLSKLAVDDPLFDRIIGILEGIRLNPRS